MSDVFEEAKSVEWPMASLTLNYDDGWLRFYPGTRLGKELFAAICRELRMSWIRIQDCFGGPWTPDREDFFTSHFGVTVTADDTDLVQLAEQRAVSYQGYSDNAAKRQQAARKAVSAIADHIPFGQPILVGHHSERRARRDAERIHNGMRKSIEEGERSGHWAGRAHRTVVRVAAKYSPSTLKNRIKQLEADLRKTQKGFDEMQAILETADPIAEVKRRDWYLMTGELTLERLQAQQNNRQRWIDYLTTRLEVANMLYEQSGKLPADQGIFEFEKGGGIQVKGRVWCPGYTMIPDHWYLIHAVNKNTLTINDADGVPGSGKLYNLSKNEVKCTMSAAEWQSSQPPRPVYKQQGKVISMAEWKKIHNDYKAIDGNGQRGVMGMRGIELVIVEK